MAEAALSGMAQCLGYSLAAAGLPLAGLSHDLTGGWEVALASCVVATVLMVILGNLAGRARSVRPGRCASRAPPRAKNINLS